MNGMDEETMAPQTFLYGETAAYYVCDLRRSESLCVHVAPPTAQLTSGLEKRCHLADPALLNGVQRCWWHVKLILVSHLVILRAVIVSPVSWWELVSSADWTGHTHVLHYLTNMAPPVISPQCWYLNVFFRLNHENALYFQWRFIVCFTCDLILRFDLMFWACLYRN